MYPVICKFGNFSIYSYGFLLAVAFLVATTLAASQAKREKVDPDVILNLSFIVFVLGIIGARIFYVVENLNYYLNNLSEIIMLQKGGLSWFGGLILGSISGLFYLKFKKLSIYKIVDLFAPFLVLGQAIGRLGCFLNGCCFGKESIYGIYSPVQEAVLIPTQLYSSFVLLLIFVFLRIMQERPHRQGDIFFAYLLLYSIKRFIIEFYRADNPVVLFGLTLFQLLSIVVFLLAFIKLFLIKTRKG